MRTRTRGCCKHAAMANSDSEVKTLLNFVNLASSDIKAALDRSAPCRRSVDHRKYLQKQLKRFSHRYAKMPRCQSLRPGDERISEQKAVACARHGRDARLEDEARPGHVPMRERQLPASFWKEPQSCSSSSSTGDRECLEQLLKRSANAIHGEKRTVIFDDSEGIAEPPRRCACTCCPFQYRALHACVLFPDTAHCFAGGLQKSSAHVVIKPIPTKPAVSSIFSVFGFV